MTYTTDSAETLAEALARVTAEVVGPRPGEWTWEEFAQALIASGAVRREAEVRAEALAEVEFEIRDATSIPINARAAICAVLRGRVAALAEEGDRPECSCAMTEGSQRRCVAHGEDDCREVQA